MSTEPEFALTFEPRPLEGASRFSLLGLLAGLGGLTAQEDAPFDDSVMDERERFRNKHFAPGAYPPGVLEAAERELANAMFGERVVDAMFGKDGPVRVGSACCGVGLSLEPDRQGNE